MSAYQPITIQFTSQVRGVESQLIVLLPEGISGKLPSRGQVSVHGMINDYAFATVLEPDGRCSHWIRITDELKRATHLQVGDEVEIKLTATDVWPEPTLSDDIANALATAPAKVKEKWQDITPMARWEWVRWVNATGSVETRAVRIVKTISKLEGKHRRPCCFNLAACTDPEISKGGRLLET